MMIRAVFIVGTLAGCQTATLAPQPAEASLGAARLKPRMAKVLVDSPDPPMWMAAGAGCGVSTITAEVEGRSDVVQAHVCVGISTSGCEAAEGAALKALQGRFSVPTSGLSGVTLHATWRGNFNTQKVCSAQVAWPFSEEQKLTQRWKDHGDRAAVLVGSAQSGGERACEQLHSAKGLLDHVPDHIEVSGGLAPRVAGVRALMVGLMTRHCLARNSVAIGVGCSAGQKATKCPMEAAAAVAKVVTQAGYNVVGTALENTEVSALLAGDKQLLRRTAKRAGAGFVFAVQLASDPFPDVGRAVKYCRGSFAFMLIDSRLGRASASGKGAGKGAGITIEQCHQKAFQVALMKARKSMDDALKVSLTKP